MVELGSALVFLILFQLEVRLGGFNLPGGPQPTVDGVGWMFAPWMPLALGRWSQHVALSCALLLAWRIRAEGGEAPTRFWGWALALTWIPPLFFPELRPVPATTGIDPVWIRGLVDGLAGAGLGWLAGGGNSPRAERRERTRLFALVGGALGWQACLTAVGLAGPVRFLGVTLGRRPFGPVELEARAGLIAVVAFQLPFWRWLTAGTGVSELGWAVACLGITFGMLADRLGQERTA